jgi:hypothetical protein
MIHRLKATLKDDLEALRSGTAMPEDSPKKTPATPRKRKTNDAAADGEAGSGSVKRRKKKNTVETTTPESPAEREDGDGGEDFEVKMEANGDLD